METLSLKGREEIERGEDNENCLREKVKEMKKRDVVWIPSRYAPLTYIPFPTHASQFNLGKQGHNNQ
jgi:hypothetical protein